MWKPLFGAVTKRHVENKILKCRPQHLFHIICQVDSYKEFLPLCTESKILQRRENGFDAALTVGLPPLFTESYVSRVRTDPELLTVRAKSIESSLFEGLDSTWILNELDHDLCNVYFEVELTVSNPLIVNALDQVLREVAGRQVAAFEQRCREIPMLKDDDDERIRTQ